jgi:ferredoxin-NADP reductase
MYRLVLYCLSLLVGVAMVFSFFGLISYPFWSLVGSLAVLLTVGFALKVGLGWVYKLPPNFESSLITALILFFVLLVPTNLSEYLGLGVGVIAALVSKYVINWRGAHVFNPAAFGALVASLTGLTSAGWWIATPIMLPFVLLIGFLILRKTRQFSLFFAFAIPALCLILLHGISPSLALTSYPLVFLGTVMLTEPITMPSNFRWRLVYGVLVGLVFGASLNFGFISTSPHLALLVGNLLAFIVTMRSGQLLRLIKRTQLSPTTYEFAFENSRFNYKAGQYLAWTLDKVKFDARGNRRSFTIASAPGEKNMKLGVKFYEPSSQFKKTLLGLKEGDGIHVSALSGDFVMPKNVNKKLLFIAGGIGVTPFRSMVKDVMLTKQKRDITLFYFANNESEVLYKDIWQEALACGVKVVPLIGQQFLTEELLQKYTPDFKEREVYLSGPPPMVRAYKKALRSLGIPVRSIHTDYFSGY